MCARYHSPMITCPTTRQPWLHALLFLTLSVLVGYSFTTARAAEKEVPPKVREGENTEKGHEAPQKSPIGIAAIVNGEVITLAEVAKASRDSSGAMSEAEARELLIQKALTNQKSKGRLAPDEEPSIKRFNSDSLTKPVPIESENGEKKPAMRDGGMKKPSTGGGEKPSSGMRDGDRPRTGERDGGKPRTGSRDGDGMKKAGARDGEGRKPSAESGQKPRKGTEGSTDTPVRSSGEVITMHVTANGDTVLINGEKQSTSGLRGHLSTFLPDHPGAKIIVSGDPDTPLKSLHEIVDAVRDNGNKNVGINAE